MSTQSEQELITFWKNFYRDIFRIELGTFSIPVKKLGQGDFNRTLVFAKGLTPNNLYTVCAEHFLCWNGSLNLDKEVLVNDRNPENGSYAIWVCDDVEVEVGGVSKNKLPQAEQEKLKIQTLMECMLHELVYFLETGKHLEKKDIILCVGSCFRDGSMPNVGWRTNTFWVRRKGTNYKEGTAPISSRIILN